jgi:hypothetical protein
MPPKSNPYAIFKIPKRDAKDLVERLAKKFDISLPDLIEFLEGSKPEKETRVVLWENALDGKFPHGVVGNTYPLIATFRDMKERGEATFRKDVKERGPGWVISDGEQELLKEAVQEAGLILVRIKRGGEEDEETPDSKAKSPKKKGPTGKGPSGWEDDEEVEEGKTKKRKSTKKVSKPKGSEEPEENRWGNLELEKEDDRDPRFVVMPLMGSNRVVSLTVIGVQDTKASTKKTGFDSIIPLTVKTRERAKKRGLVFLTEGHIKNAKKDERDSLQDLFDRAE